MAYEEAFKIQKPSAIVYGNRPLIDAPAPHIFALNAKGAEMLDNVSDLDFSDYARFMREAAETMLLDSLNEIALRN